MVQDIIVGILFTGSLGYLAWIFRKNFATKQGNCAKGCGCGAFDMKKIEENMKMKKNSLNNTAS